MHALALARKSTGGGSTILDAGVVFAVGGAFLRPTEVPQRLPPVSAIAVSRPITPFLAITRSTFSPCRRAVSYHRTGAIGLMDHRRQQLAQAFGALLCAGVACRFTLNLEGTEFSGGRVTGPLLHMQGIGIPLFLLAAVLTFPFRRVASAIALLACLLCIPLHLLFTAPGPFRWVFRGEWKTPLSSSFVWEWWSVGAIAALIFAVFTSLRSFVDSSARL